jgi:hypothetical protein
MMHSATVVVFDIFVFVGWFIFVRSKSESDSESEFVRSWVLFVGSVDDPAAEEPAAGVLVLSVRGDFLVDLLSALPPIFPCLFVRVA